MTSRGPPTCYKYYAVSRLWGSCEHDNERSDSIRAAAFLDQLSYCHVLSKDSTSFLVVVVWYNKITVKNRTLFKVQPHCGSGVDSASNRNEYQESSWG
jgi:hypothetical protein